LGDGTNRLISARRLGNLSQDTTKGFFSSKVAPDDPETHVPGEPPEIPEPLITTGTSIRSFRHTFKNFRRKKKFERPNLVNSRYFCFANELLQMRRIELNEESRI
jgi:hypothetical protein